ncbi:hypothetical protein DUNSADRAFT_4336 [Dunaliella salina]|uniref:Uncharacterized protein n=1 Tax=Dunaliella salina TaxID=3046 RepID=A0ABQ7H7Q5_DUNSA|nr:hypothetical protein DUNSADRAFT_4336 [Dunaliella salina]|eukprot:KAF5842877.1 hypothetical protein DUNSADRAFT_4336 [Dunaliella salina]
MSLLIFGSSNCEVSAAVVKTGGDFARIEPAEEGDLARFPELRMRMRSRSSCPSASSNATSADGDSRSTGKQAESSARTSGAPLSNSGGHYGTREGGAATASTYPSDAANGAKNNRLGPQATSLLAEEEGLIGVEQLLATRIHFSPSVLHAGLQADQHLAAFAPKLKGRGAAVTMGTMRVDGLQEDFI